MTFSCSTIRPPAGMRSWTKSGTGGPNSRRDCPARGQQRHRDQLALRDTLGKAKDRGHEIAFVCQGNICRSPVAAALLEREIEGASGLRVSSFGNLPRTGAASPPNAIAAARSWDVDLKMHRSRHFSQDAAEEASLIVIFDETNRRWIENRHPA